MSAPAIGCGLSFRGKLSLPTHQLTRLLSPQDDHDDHRSHGAIAPAHLALRATQLRINLIPVVLDTHDRPSLRLGFIEALIELADL
jgi:hypothetical protein